MVRSTSKHFKFGALARRYASAIFDLASEEGRTRPLLEEFQRFNDALQKVPLLCKSLEDKEISNKSKRQIITEIAKVISLSAVSQNAIMLIAQKGRLTLFDSITESYRKMAEELERMARVEVQVANQALVKTVQDGIEKILSDVLKKKIVCDTRVDSSLIGGAIVKIGDVAIDASIAGRLAKMKEELI